jgi:hypothetical protein
MRLSSFCVLDDLHCGAGGRVPSHRCIEKVLDMTKIIAPPHTMSMADRVTYGVVAGVVVLGILAFMFLQ